MAGGVFEVKLVPVRSTWALVALTWAPFLAMIPLVMLASLLERSSESAAVATSAGAALIFIGGLLFVALRWRRGPTLRIDAGVLTVGDRRAPLAMIRATRGEHVYRSYSRYASGVYWRPMLVLALPEGEPLRIGCDGAGGRARGRKPGVAPHYSLDRAAWEALAQRVGGAASAAG